VNIPPEVLAVITALASTVTALASVVYRELKAQVTDCRAENATLRAEARETVNAAKAEKDEWKRLALAQKPGASQ
jgi:hypothetical protein